ncbi:hypothetical protein [Pseudodesulfovibrio sediminis]|uniref:Uncharacterized protein n=1 Tax=Pseudodesulfovibrio sediminis TaxID=2810563 RepID=A0ABN6ELD6_9BACT|nr:hypothetical protein [Pseudodesulfovibrio sediminis]BCS86836.1 hypothetical protein PSDVSF_00780 [Pseudodesulfovibrio sediminis]
MHIELIHELQFRALSGMQRYPELFKTTPVYLCGQEPWLTIRKALEAYQGGKVGHKSLLRGMLAKYGEVYFDELLRVLENAEAVPCKNWALTQIARLSDAISQNYEEGRHAA